MAQAKKRAGAMRDHLEKQRPRVATPALLAGTPTPQPAV